MAATLLGISEGEVVQELDAEYHTRRNAWRTKSDPSHSATDLIDDFEPFLSFTVRHGPSRGSVREAFWSSITGRYVIIVDGQGHSADDRSDVIRLLTE